MKYIIAMLLTVVIIVQPAYGNKEQFMGNSMGETCYNINDIMVINYARRGGVESIFKYKDSIGIVQIAKNNITAEDSEAGVLFYPYKVYSKNKLIAEIVILNFSGNKTITISTAGGEERSLNEDEILLEYDFITHKVIGEEYNEKTVLFDSNTAIYNEISPLVQEDKNGIGRSWCFLSSMGMIINLYEGTNYKTHDIAKLYINNDEINYSNMNNDGYIPNRDIYYGNTQNNIRYALEYRGYKPITTKISYDSAKSLVDDNKSALLFFNRYRKEVEKIGTKDIIIKEQTDINNTYYTELLNKHAVVLYGYDKIDNTIIVADPSPTEKVPGPYTPTISKLINQNGTFYLYVRESDYIETLENDIYKVYRLGDTYKYKNENIYTDYIENTKITGQENKRFSGFACLSEIYKHFEGIEIKSEEVAYNLLPSNVVDYVKNTEYDIFRIPGGSEIGISYFEKILSFRGYTVSNSLGYKAYKLSNIKSLMDIGYKYGLTFDIININGEIEGTHIALVESVDIENNKFKIMDPSGIGSYRLIDKSTDIEISGDYYGHGYKLKPHSFFYFKLGQTN